MFVALCISKMKMDLNLFLLIASLSLWVFSFWVEAQVRQPWVHVMIDDVYTLVNDGRRDVIMNGLKMAAGMGLLISAILVFRVRKRTAEIREYIIGFNSVAFLSWCGWLVLPLILNEST